MAFRVYNGASSRQVCQLEIGLVQVCRLEVAVGQVSVEEACNK